MKLPKKISTSGARPSRLFGRYQFIRQACAFAPLFWMHRISSDTEKYYGQCPSGIRPRSAHRSFTEPEIF